MGSLLDDNMSEGSHWDLQSFTPPERSEDLNKREKSDKAKRPKSKSKPKRKSRSISTNKARVGSRRKRTSSCVSCLSHHEVDVKVVKSRKGPVKGNGNNELSKGVPPDTETADPACWLGLSK